MYEKIQYFPELTATAILKKIVTFNCDFASHDINRTHRNSSRSCDYIFVHKAIEIEWRKDCKRQIECTLLRSKNTLNVA